MRSKNFLLKAALVIFAAFLSTSIKATNYYLKTTGAVSLTSSWTDDITLAAGNSPINLIGSGHTWHFTNRTAATMIGSTFGNAGSPMIIYSGLNLTFSLTLATQNCLSPITIASGGSLTICRNKNLVFSSLDQNSTVTYSNTGKVIQVGGPDYGNLVIAESTTFPLASLAIVSNSLIINSGRTLTMNQTGLYLTGSVGGLGTIRGDAAAFIAHLGGNGGDNGTLRFDSGFEFLNALELTFPSSSDFISLGTDLNIVGGYAYISQGKLNLNGNNLILDNASDLSFDPAGSIRANSSSGLFINGTFGINSGDPNLYMDPSNNTLGVLALDGSGAIVEAGNAININDSLSIKSGADFTTNNNVTLVSTSSLKGRLAQFNGTLNGNLTVQTFARGGITDWVNIGVSGITGETIQSGWYNQIPMTIEGSPTGVTSANSQYFESVQKWDESVSYYDTLVTWTDALVPGEGYWLFLGDALTTTNDMVWTVSGTAVTGAVPINLTNSGVTSSVSSPGFNLIANPYPSPINWNNVINNPSNASAAVNDAYYIYDPDLANTVSFVNGAASPSSGTLTNYQTMADIIPMGQAFYVEATGNTVLTFNEADKSPNNGSNFQLLRSTNSAANIGNIIRLNIDGGGYHDDAVIRFHSNATSSFDKTLDAHKMYSSPGYVGYPGQWSIRTCIATKSGNEDYSINSLPYAHTQNAVIPVIARVYVSGQHTISASELQNLPPGTCVDLKDLYDNSIHDLTAGDYVVTMSDTTYYPRFELTVCANLTTDVKTISAASAKNAVNISRSEQGVFVAFDYEKPTDATIYATNILGQTIMTPKKVKASNETMYLDIDSDDQLIFVTVITKDGRTTKKILNKL